MTLLGRAYMDCSRESARSGGADVGEAIRSIDGAHAPHDSEGARP